jgi:16S rRNA (cytidine1402-2'-O)-methyltransferase
MPKIYIIATPIGNLNDISLRAIEILRTVDVVAAEDTRHSQKLLAHFQIQTTCISYHEHNEKESTDKIIEICKQGKSVALLSDAGTPLISDPGYQVVKAAHAAQIKIIPVPGACAAIAALSVAGLASDRFIFEGFLPAKATARQTRLTQLREETRTLVFYEAPHRIVEMIADACLIFGEAREATIARELTKTFETIHKASLKELCQWLKEDVNQTKGEFVVIVAGIDEIQLQQLQLAKAEKLLKELLSYLPLKKAVQLAVEMTQVPKNVLYELALQYQKNTE